MKRMLPLLAAVVIGAVVLLRPVPPPSAAAVGWSSAEPHTARRGTNGRKHPASSGRALAYVTGEVARPGVYPVAGDARVGDVLKQAGGARSGADLAAVNLAAHVADGDEVVVPARGQAGAPSPAPRPRRHRAAGTPRHPGARGHRRHRNHPGAPPVAVVDINAADAESLATIPGIGDGLAERIVAFREQNGPFASIDELLDVSGITEHRLDAMIPYVVAR